MNVELIDHMGSDTSIVRAARVSTNNDLEATTPQKQRGLIRYLLSNRHTSPFEHVTVTFRVEAPMFVRDQWVRHRTMSYNIQSLRFSEATPHFYYAPKDRPLVNAGSGAHPDLVHPEEGDKELHSSYMALTEEAYEHAWAMYTDLLYAGVAEELARAVLPTGLYTSFYVTANLWNWLQFLDKRIESENNKPQWEIEQLALQVKEKLTQLFPVTMEAWAEDV